MPQMNFDLEDGKPPISFALKPDDCARFVQFMQECTQAIATRAQFRAAMNDALARARIFDDGSDGADGESAKSVVGILSAALAA